MHRIVSFGGYQAVTTKGDAPISNTTVTYSIDTLAMTMNVTNPQTSSGPPGRAFTSSSLVAFPDGIQRGCFFGGTAFRATFGKAREALVRGTQRVSSVLGSHVSFVRA